MNSLKSIAMTTLGIVAAIALFGLLASVGLAVIGALAIAALVSAILTATAAIKPAQPDAVAA